MDLASAPVFALRVSSWRTQLNVARNSVRQGMQSRLHAIVLLDASATHKHLVTMEFAVINVSIQSAFTLIIQPIFVFHPAPQLPSISQILYLATASVGVLTAISHRPQTEPVLHIVPLDLQTT